MKCPHFKILFLFIMLVVGIFTLLTSHLQTPFRRLFQRPASNLKTSAALSSHLIPPLPYPLRPWSRLSMIDVTPPHGNTFLVEEAYFDARLPKPHPGRVVLMGSKWAHYTPKNVYIDDNPLYCHILYHPLLSDGDNSTILYLSIRAEIVNIKEATYIPYTTFMWFCALPTHFATWTSLHQPPTVHLTIGSMVTNGTQLEPHVTSTILSSEGNTTLPFKPALSIPLKYIPPRKLQPSTTESRFTLCLAPAFGYFREERYIGLLEMVHLLGVEQVHIYTMTAHQDNSHLKGLWNYYALARKLVTITEWELPSTLVGKVHYNSQLLAIQHCLYRAIQHSNYIIFHDFDELLVPGEGYHNLGEMIQGMNTARNASETETACGYCFLHAFFYNEEQPHLDLEGFNSPPYFRAVDRSSALTKDFRDMFRCKCLAFANRVEEMGIHHVAKCLGPNSTRGHIAAELSEGLIHHYSSQCISPDTRRKNERLCKLDKKNSAHTLLPLREKYELAVQTAWRQVHFNRPSRDFL